MRCLYTHSHVCIHVRTNWPIPAIGLLFQYCKGKKEGRKEGERERERERERGERERERRERETERETEIEREREERERIACTYMWKARVNY